MIGDTDHLEEGRDHAVGVDELDALVARRTRHDPVEQGAGGGEVDPHQRRARNGRRGGVHQLGIELVPDGVAFTTEFARQQGMAGRCGGGRRLEAMLAVADAETSLIITGNGDVLEPEGGIVAIGSGGAYAQAAARALLDHTDMPADQVVKKALVIAGELCIYTNMNHTIETL